MGSKPAEAGITLTVRIWGMGADGRAFFQKVQARDLRSNGAHLSGIDRPLTQGDVIGVQLGDKKARFQILHAVDTGHPDFVKAEIEIIPGQECPWQDQLSVLVSSGAAQSAAGASPSNKRRFPRHKIPFPVEIGDSRGNSPLQTTASDVRGRGCYVETLAPYPLNTQLQVSFWKREQKVSTAAVVRASISGVGMGIEFTGLPLEQQRQLQKYIEEIDPSSGGFASTRGD
jgi:hypothetical protein